MFARTCTCRSLGAVACAAGPHGAGDFLSLRRPRRGSGSRDESESAASEGAARPGAPRPARPRQPPPAPPRHQL
ncbi:hypothetical protein JYU34_007870 [Plutella xylostella]|uniref:Uncharacterized protein n=1 Tax=Plutella xylostella TaxID=51655 RepID=A0ABQ7QRK1_PLUXY|nr:hypothetical protein JYU34_007870 [Plutella xylostella]